MSPGETRRQELAREYEGVPSAQAFIAVCERFLEARYEAEKWAELVLMYRDRAARAAAEVAALKRERDESLVIVNAAREFHASCMADSWNTREGQIRTSKARNVMMTALTRTQPTPVSEAPSQEPKP